MSIPGGKHIPEDFQTSIPTLDSTRLSQSGTLIFSRDTVCRVGDTVCHAIQGEMTAKRTTEASGKYFLPYQQAWVRDASPLKIMEKSRQVGISYADAYDSVVKAALRGARHDVWISSRDEAQARLYLNDCAAWARILELGARTLKLRVLPDDEGGSAQALEFASGRRIYSLSSNPNALAGKRGHVKLDEFALHQDQRLLYRVAKPTMWGGQLCIISTHRGALSVFNEILRGIRERGNAMGWSLHSVPLERAVSDGIVERINAKRGTTESRESFMRRLRAECLDERQWLQEYCCVPCAVHEEFLSPELLAACTEPNCLRTIEYLGQCPNPIYLGVDVARRKDLCVIDAGESIGDVVWDRLRIELLDQPFDRIEMELYRLLELAPVQRACIDATGLGLQLAERARQRFGWKAEPVVFTAAVKEELAFTFKADLERRQVRLADDEPLRRDLLSLRKETTQSGRPRFAGSSEDSHCDRFWAKALRQHAARRPVGPAAMVG